MDFKIEFCRFWTRKSHFGAKSTLAPNLNCWWTFLGWVDLIGVVGPNWGEWFFGVVDFWGGGLFGWCSFGVLVFWGGGVFGVG